MKNLYTDEFSLKQIQEMNEEQFQNLNPFELRSCYNCEYLKGYINLWCTNQTAVDSRGTAIPGGIKCNYWQPNRETIKREYPHSELTIELLNQVFIINIKRKPITEFIFWLFSKFGKKII